MTRPLEARDLARQRPTTIAEADVPDTEWLSSWSAVDGNRFLCLWEAPNEDPICAALGEKGLSISPIDVAYEVIDVNPDIFRQE